MSKTFEWQTADPTELGLDPERLRALWDTLASHNTTGFLLIKDDKIVLEKYIAGWNAQKPHYTASMAKALVGGMSLCLAMDDGLLGPDDPVFKYVPQWEDDPLKAKVTIRHLATHTSGLEDAELTQEERKAALAKGITLTDHHLSLPGWKGEFWKQEPRDPFTVSRDSVATGSEPGTANQYSNPGMAMLSYAITAALKDSPIRDIRTLLCERVMKPIGVADDEWSVGYGKTFEADGLSLVANWGGGSFTARATARLVRLMLRKGDWEGRRVIRAETVEKVLAHAGCPNDSGLGWWVNRTADGGKVIASAPADAFWGAGAGHQIGAGIPSEDIIFVRNGELLGSGDYNQDKIQYLWNPLMEAIKG